MFAMPVAFVLTGATLVSSVFGHALIASPVPRQPGPGFAAACGSTAESIVSSDQYGNIQNYISTVPSTCHPWLCKGLVYSDQAPSETQTYSIGQVVPIEVTVRAPHGGPASVNVLDTTKGTNGTTLGDPLISWELYASSSTGVAANMTNFSVKIPKAASQCTTAGKCVLQFLWLNPSINQTYESCIDFVVNSSNTTRSSSPAFPSASSPSTAMTGMSGVSTSTAHKPPKSSSGWDDDEWEWICD